MLDLFDEFRALIAELEKRQIDYALCGGLALAIYAQPRATVDIDLLILAGDFEAVRKAARDLGYTFDAAPMSFRGGEIEIRRVSKIDPDTGDPLMLDLVMVTPSIEAAWKSRQAMVWQHGTVWVVSAEGLILLKSKRGSAQDVADIAALTGSGHEP